MTGHLNIRKCGIDFGAMESGLFVQTLQFIKAMWIVEVLCVSIGTSAFGIDRIRMQML